ncbi:MAG: hypothetical protein GY845_26690 [Planctomycetes bacterium]|nr:hypothetical protein [Planctomycetota bacterium]
MIHNILASTVGKPVISILGVFILLAVYGFIFALIIICLIRVSRYFMSADKEQKLIRMELGKLAEEVHLLRQEHKDDKDSDSSTQ